MVAPPVTKPPPRLAAHAISHAGRRRSQNEDAFGTFLSDRLFIVADGMGGGSAGETASHMAVDEVSAFFKSFHDNPRQPWPYPVDSQHSLGANLLRVGIKVANDKIRDAAEAEAERIRSQTKALIKAPLKMACTMVAVAVGDTQLSIAHAGDARAYRFRDGSLRQLTTDHSLMAEMIAARPELAEAEIDPLAHGNVVTKTVGRKPDLEPAVTIKRFQTGDTYLLCSDGLWRSVNDSVIRDVLSATTDLEAGCQMLVDAANDAGGPDNITVLIVRIVG